MSDLGRHHPWRAAELPCGEHAVTELGGASLIDLQNAVNACREKFAGDFSAKLSAAALAIAASETRAARLMLRRAAVAVAAAPSGETFAAYLTALIEAARRRPEVVPDIIAHQGDLLAALHADRLGAWVSVGLALAESEPTEAKAFFRLETQEARRLLARLSGAVTFDSVETSMRALVRALWGRNPVMATCPDASRTSFSDGLIHLPETFPGPVAERAKGQFRAALTHIMAHLIHGGPPMPPEGLKPLQITLISLIEDARVEHLAGIALPGLLRSWACQAEEIPVRRATAEGLLHRLVRALFSPDIADNNSWVSSAQDRFFQQRDAWQDPGFSRRFGGLLGNELGQMRLPFDVRNYEVLPSYRDDNAGLWQLPPGDQAAADLQVTDTRDRTGADDAGAYIALKTVPSGGSGKLLGQYPEWNHAIGAYHPAWVDVWSHDPKPAPLSAAEKLLEGMSREVAATEKLLRSAREPQSRRRKHLLLGDALDLDACIRMTTHRHVGLRSESRIYQTRRTTSRRLAVHILLDISNSTRNRIGETLETPLSIERKAAAILAEAMHRIGDNVAIAGFCSDGRRDVRLFEVKRFSEPFDRSCLTRLGGLRGQLSTRLGAALRVCGDRFRGHEAADKLILLLTDGEPADVDVPDARHLVEDACQAIHELNERAIRVFSVVVGHGIHPEIPRLFSKTGFARMNEVNKLPIIMRDLFR